SILLPLISKVSWPSLLWGLGSVLCKKGFHMVTEKWCFGLDQTVEFFVGDAKFVEIDSPLSYEWTRVDGFFHHVAGNATAGFHGSNGPINWVGSSATRQIGRVKIDGT